MHQGRHLAAFLAVEFLPEDGTIIGVLLRVDGSNDFGLSASDFETICTLEEAHNRYGKPYLETKSGSYITSYYGNGTDQDCLLLIADGEEYDTVVYAIYMLANNQLQK